ncbi:HEPN domain-containing protein [Candidatus Woesearchaeota archaeon]|nr:HEPN domain-containing protein [Candidatus Woesearchaeota archaeon]
MLDERRIKEAETNVNSYRSEGLLLKKEFQGDILKILIKNAEESIKVAQHLFEEELSDLWVIVASYYSMYYYANAVLLKLGYKVGDKISHKVTADALIVFARKKLKESLIEDYEDLKEEALNIAGMKADTIVESFDHEREKRHRIQYRTVEVEKHSKAKTSLDRAKHFMLEMKKLLEQKNKHGR